LLRRRLRARQVRMARIAGGIGDPVLRLRFLKTAMAQSSAAARLRFHWFVWLALLLTMLIPSLVRRAAGSPEPLKARVVRPEPPLAHGKVGDAVAVKTAVKVAPVWQVEKTGESEVYSNGLRVDTRFAVLNHPRLYLAFPRDGNLSSGPIPRSQPVGIVYHTTESRQAPFVAQDNRVLMRLGESLLEYVCRERAYHYLIDRFGRVYRVVAESDAANHAGYSVWADDKWLYVNLNDSFFGVSFEAQSHAGKAEGVASPAQIRAAAMLTEMLRSRYQISAENCVTHAQVSVNPSNMHAGYHTDWAAGFPFAALGLPDNYGLPLPSLWAFGFANEPANRISPGVQLADQDLSSNAARSGMPLQAYRKRLQKQYRECLAQSRRAGS
jgi:N-acetylmuramoyl-L-alanine amidase